jgi:hypothetical protein
VEEDIGMRMNRLRGYGVSNQYLNELTGRGTKLRGHFLKQFSALVCTLLVVVSFSSFPSIGDPPTWSIEDVDSQGTVGKHTSIAVDNNNRPHVSYKADGGGLKYAHLTQNGWIFEMADPSSNIGRHTSIALNSEYRPHICYWDEISQITKYAERTDTGWSIIDIESNGWDGWCSIDFDSSDTPHVSYYKQSAPDAYLKYAKLVGSSWAIEQVDEEAGWYNSIIIDTADTPHISYKSHENDIHTLKYAVRTGPPNRPWKTETVDPTPGAGVYTSIALDASEVPHIAYHMLPSGLWHAARTGPKRNPWVLEPIDSVGNVGQWCSIDIGNDDIPRVSYYDNLGPTDGNLKYAERTGSPPDSWITEPVDEENKAGAYTSIAVDPTNCPHISYYDATNSSLKYAFGCGAANQSPIADFTWTWDSQEPLPSEGEVIHFMDLSYDPDGTIVSWSWDFELLSPSTEQNPDRTYGDNGVFQVTLEVEDDLGATDSITKDVTVMNLDPIIDYINSTIHNNTQRTHGYWKKQCDFGPGNPPPSDDHVGIKQEYIDFVAENSLVWAGITTKDPVCDDLSYVGSERVKLLRKQLIAVWLNVAAGYLFIDSPLHHSKTSASSVGEFINIAEDAIIRKEDGIPGNDPSRKQLGDLKDVADQINNDPQDGWIATDPSVGVYEAKVTDPGSDDLTLVWTFDGGPSTRQEIVTYYNDGSDPDPYPSPWGTYPFTIIDVQIIGYPISTAILNPNLDVMDDDGGHAMDEDPGETWSADWTFEFEVSSRIIEFGFTIYDVQITYLDWDSVIIIIDPWEY